jgi:hypothetical protein
MQLIDISEKNITTGFFQFHICMTSENKDTGFIIALILGFQSLYKGIINWRNRKKWTKETVLSTKRQ